MAVSLINSNQTQNIRVDLNDIDDYLYVAIINDGQESEITFEVWYQENRKHSDILGTLYVILSVVGIVILIIGMICIFRKKCRRPIAKIQSDLIGISHELMSKQFPIMKFSNVRSPSNTTCSICFETYNHNSCIRRLYCDHLFCAMCIEEWFKTSKTCCLCKRDCSILEDQVFSNEFWKRAHANSINLQMNHINITEIN